LRPGVNRINIAGVGVVYSPLAAGAVYLLHLKLEFTSIISGDDIKIIDKKPVAHYQTAALFATGYSER
jgi:hypothetical protein